MGYSSDSIKTRRIRFVDIDVDVDIAYYLRYSAANCG
jgi:hypothetical protein